MNLPEVHLWSFHSLLNHHQWLPIVYRIKFKFLSVSVIQGPVWSGPILGPYLFHAPCPPITWGLCLLLPELPWFPASVALFLFFVPSAWNSLFPLFAPVLHRQLLPLLRGLPHMTLPTWKSPWVFHLLQRLTWSLYFCTVKSQNPLLLYLRALSLGISVQICFFRLHWELLDGRVRVWFFFVLFIL